MAVDWQPAAEYTDIRYELSGDGIAKITINRPEVRNAFRPQTIAEMRDAFARARDDTEVGAIIFTGAGDEAFCAGADLKAIETFGPRMDDPRGPLGFTRVTPSKPTIAAISGWCLAGGFELALWCDLRIATSGSQLGFPERRWASP